MKNINKLIDCMVITQDGIKLGKVCDIVFDCKTNKILALLIATNSLIPLTKALEFDKINTFLPKKIIVSSKSDLISLISLDLSQSAKRYIIEIDKKKVFNHQNKHIGSVRDAVFNMEAGEISDFLIYNGFVKNLFKQGTTVSISHDVTIKKDNIIITKNKE